MRPLIAVATASAVAVVMALPASTLLEPDSASTGRAADEPATLAMVGASTAATAPDEPARERLAPARFVRARTVGASVTPAKDLVPGAGRIPDVALSAYLRAMSVAPPSCHLDLALMAALGEVESGNLRGVTLDRRHRPSPPMFGPVLDGRGVPRVRDTDAGQLDGNRRWDRGVGPFHLLPHAWAEAGVDLDLDGRRDAQDVDDAAGAVMVYLCAPGLDLATRQGLRVALRQFNHRGAYRREVTALRAVFAAQLALLEIAAPVLHGVVEPGPGTNEDNGGAAGPGHRRSGRARHGDVTPGPADPGPQPGSAPGSGTASPSSSPSAGATDAGGSHGGGSHGAAPSSSGTPAPTATPSDGPSDGPSESPSGGTDGATGGTPTDCATPTPDEAPTPSSAPDPTTSPSPTDLGSASADGTPTSTATDPATTAAPTAASPSDPVSPSDTASPSATATC